MQSRLMDVNTSAIKRRNEISSGLDSENYEKVFGACNALNALLPEQHLDDGRQKYRITISDILYRKFTHHDVKISCTECKEQSIFQKIKVFELLVPMALNRRNGDRMEKVWICPKCKAQCNLIKSEMTEPTIREPFFIRVVPKPPKHTDGILDRNSYHKKVVEWTWRFLGEWEASMAQFRDDNWQKKEMYDEDDFVNSGEDAD